MPSDAARPRKTAEISPCQQYRYSLTRDWNDALSRVGIIGLNPSEADALKDDPTIRKETGFSSRLGFGGFLKLNRYAYRTPYPKVLWEAEGAGIDIIPRANQTASNLICQIRLAESQFVKFGKPGMADILIAPIVKTPCCSHYKCGSPTIPAFIWCEVKSPAGRMSEAQEQFQKEVTEQGMTYVVARSLEDVQKVLEAR